MANANLGTVEDKKAAIQNATNVIDAAERE